MGEGVVIKSKTDRATKIVLWLALVLIFMMLLIILAQGGAGGVSNRMLLAVIVVVIVGFFVKRKKRNAPKSQADIIKFVADHVYKHFASELNVLSVNVERGAAGETYVHFIEDRITYLYLENVGVIETHVGKDIGIVKRENQTDEIAMAVAKDGLASQRNRERLNDAGLYKEEGEI
ncbi:hypothetical protein KAR91_74390 [Candidatus Pacearchaeota archaeon]|nr:hypothetical protein [Candidatus Pacearchaeota archaeon]